MYASRDGKMNRTTRSIEQALVKSFRSTAKLTAFGSLFLSNLIYSNCVMIHEKAVSCFDHASTKVGFDIEL